MVAYAHRRSVTVTELAAVARLVASEPVLVLDIDEGARGSESVVTSACNALGHMPALVVGVACEPLTDAGRRLATAVTTTLSGHDEGRVTVRVDDPHAAVEELRTAVSARATAARVLGQLLRNIAASSVWALWAESLAFSTLLGGEEFRSWLQANRRPEMAPSSDPVLLSREGDVLRITLNRPERRNALDASTRAALADALDVGVADRRVRIELSGNGVAFSSGGDLAEFGTATDLAAVHHIRLEHGPAVRMLAVADRTTAFVHGPCVGAGVELAAFAGHVVAAEGTTFRLPEVSMGLVPGAGGTVSVPARIGRWRAAWWMLSGTVLPARQAHEWGLVDDVA